MQKIVPYLWFDTQAEEAVQFYTSVFKESKVGRVMRYSEAGAEVSGKPAGSVMSVEFELFGQQFVALNGGPHFKFTPAISLLVNCDTQAEVDAIWAKMSEGGEEWPCGWLQDKFGVTWQIYPHIVDTWINDPDPVVAERTTRAMLQIEGKFDIEMLRRVHAGEDVPAKA